MPEPEVIRQRVRSNLRMVEVVGMPAMFVVARPKHGDQVLAVVSADEPPATLRRMARIVLRDEERRHLAAFLDLRRKR